MNLQDLFEANLRLIPGETEKVRGSYGAFIITMHPEDFLRLTACPEDREQIEQTPFPRPADKLSDFQTDGRFPLPFLNVYWPSGKISGHEGRHRALMVLRKGGTAFPVCIYLNTDVRQAVTYSREVEDTGEFTKHEQEFASPDEANAFAEHLKSQPDDGIYYWSIKRGWLGGDKIKGSPNYTDPTDPWKKKPFTAADMPKQLVAQYTNDIVVTDFKVGLVKGYSHFRD